ncbi:sirohydrochlorin chelatase [Streptomyces sp. S07_1.15]|uniref:sirohydrochlorin chelatase n=1 Tax=Streptomyces sp. S07_1.15 TaxID=2873925 RepID=UPI001D14B644|nr:sirohydrochlorin chelatase [Streptomyces sp. S07_1.15]MCC3654229.1 sirohydrochlorin chelatase [Streptomyces sp. S07_1.15]
MTASTPHPGPHGRRPGPLDLDSTAQLMHRIGSRLGTALHSIGARGGHPYPTTRRSGTRSPVLVAVAHGSRDPEALRTVTELLDRVRALRPGLSVRLGHIELNEPLLPETLAETEAALRTGHPAAPGAGPGPGPGTGDRGAAAHGAVLVPLLLSRGYHVKHDIPRILADSAPALRAVVAAPLGPHPLLAEALHARLTEAAGDPRGPEGGLDGYDGVVLAAAGSRDPDGARDTGRTARLLGARLGGVPVLPAYASAADPTVPEAVRELRARGCRRVAVASYFTAPGRFATLCAQAAPDGLAAAPLGAHTAMARLVLHRYDEALAAATPPAVRTSPLRTAGPGPGSASAA